MPIYAYRCASCGHAQDVLQKLSDPTLTVCPACGAEAYAKQVTAAGFQLKGSGWYVTDFRGGNAPAPKKDGESAAPATAGAAVPAPADKASDKPADKPSSTASETSAPAAPPPAAAS